MGLNKPRVSTADATAFPSDIFPGKTAYARGSKLVGNATADATATPGNIINGATAYVNGEKITGTLIPDTLDDLTADATATASEIFPGKTAYAKGSKLSGTATADATATAENIVNGATAYVNGAKITGTLPDLGVHVVADSVYNVDANGNLGVVCNGRAVREGIMWRPAVDAGVIPENIVTGKTVFGLAGTGSIVNRASVTQLVHPGSTNYTATAVLSNGNKTLTVTVKANGASQAESIVTIALT